MPNTHEACPVCQTKGKAVDTQTVKAMLAVSLTTLRTIPYHFCRTPDCPVVYFATDGQQIFRESDLRDLVYQKHDSDDAVWVCYCFRHSLSTIRADLAMTGVSTVVDQIKAGIAAEHCACDIRNPQGDCCLGNVLTLLKRLKTNTSTLEAAMTD